MGGQLSSTRANTFANDVKADTSAGGINTNGQLGETSFAEVSPTAHTLQFAKGGYVSFAAKSGNVIPHTANAGQCALACQRDPNCVAWTRVAGA